MPVSRGAIARLLVALTITRAHRLVRRRTAIAALAPMPANAMWQLWLPSDMERFVAEADATADSVLAQMDKCAETSWMMNMGSEKGILIEKVIAQRRPKRLLEIGTFLGYMSIRLARSMPVDAILTTVEIDEDNYAASRRIRAKALGKRDASVVALKANASQAIQSFKQPFDFVLMDHWKPVLTQRRWRRRDVTPPRRRRCGRERVYASRERVASFRDAVVRHRTTRGTSRRYEEKVYWRTNV